MKSGYRISCSVERLIQIAEEVQGIGAKLFRSKLESFLVLYCSDSIHKFGRHDEFLRKNSKEEFLLLRWGFSPNFVLYFPKVKLAKAKKIRGIFESYFVKHPPILKVGQDHYFLSSRYVEKFAYEKIKKLVLTGKKSKQFVQLPKFNAEIDLRPGDSVENLGEYPH